MAAHRHSYSATSHPHSDADVVAVGRGPKVVVVLLLVVVAAAVVAGLVALWPTGAAVDRVQERSPYAVPGATFPDARVTAVEPPCPRAEDDGLGGPALPGSVQQGPDCGAFAVEVTSGQDEGLEIRLPVAPEVTASGLRAGDRLGLIRTPDSADQPATFNYQSTKRGPTLAWMTVAFALIVVAVARLRGLLAIVGLALSVAMLTQFMLPALLTGEPGLWVALSGAVAIMYVVLYSTHGVSWRTSAALVGTLAGIGVTAAIAWYAVGAARFSGVTDEAGQTLGTVATGIDFQQLLLCGVVLAGLGVLNDVTITQASAVWELRAAAPTSSRASVFASAMRIGRDHIASTIYTIFFAYAGSAIVVLLLISIFDRPILDLLSFEELAEEVARTLASGIGVVLAVPLTTAIAALIASPVGGPGVRR